MVTAKSFPFMNAGDARPPSTLRIRSRSNAARRQQGVHMLIKRALTLAAVSMLALSCANGDIGGSTGGTGGELGSGGSTATGGTTDTGGSPGTGGGNSTGGSTGTGGL